jgi:ferredoxin-type protein NapF
VGTSVIRPPWALPGPRFLDRCTRCGDCARACDQKIIGLDGDGLPEMDFRLGACTFCGRCVTACEPEALLRPASDGTTRPWSLDVRFDDDCLERQGITCRVCGDGCEQEAIRFRPDTTTRSVPCLDDGRCNGCGACRWVCPIDAVTIRPRPAAVG